MRQIKYLLFLLLTVAAVNATAAVSISGCSVKQDREGIANYWEASTYEKSTCTMTISPAAAVTLTASAGNSISCSPNCTAATSVVFTAPTAVPYTANHFGCPAMPSDSIFATQVSNLPLHPNNTTIMSTLYGADVNSNTKNIGWVPAISYNEVRSSTPTRTWNFYYSTWLNNVQFPDPDRPGITREGGLYNNYGNMDHFWGMVNRDTCTHYEIYKDLNTYSPACAYPTCNAGSAWVFNPGDYDLPEAYDQLVTTAGGTSRLATTWSANDIRNGTIRNAIEATMPNYAILFKGASNGGFVWPATQPSSNTQATSLDTTKLIGYGYWFRLNAAWVTANLANYSPIAQNLIRGLRDYGAIVVDISPPASNAAFQVEYDADAFRDPDVRAALLEIGQGRPLTFDNLEIVDQSSLRIQDSWSGRINPANAYVTPSQFASLTVNNGTDPAATVYMSVLPISVGTTRTSFAQLAGSGAIQLDSWVTGATNQSVTWSLVSGTGSVTSAGLYTPAATVTSAGVTDVLKLTAVADSTATQTVVVSVLPKDSAHPNSYAINVAGAYCDTTSGCTRMYLPDLRIPQIGYINFPNFIDSVGDFPAWGGTDSKVWSWWWQSSGGQDFDYGSFALPNGNYKVTFMSGHGNQCGVFGSIPKSYNGGQYAHDPYVLDAAGQIGGQVSFGKLSALDHACRQKTSYTIPAKVTNGFLDHIGMRMIASDAFGQSTPISSPQLNGLIVEPDTTTSAHWSIDNQQTKSLAPGSSLQFRQIDWYTGATCQNPDHAKATSTCTWSLSGPGAIDPSTGMYTAPSSIGTTTPATVSVTDGTNSASYSFLVTGSTVQGMMH